MDNANNDFTNCPLVPHHRLLRHRLPYHLVRCRFQLQLAANSLLDEWRTSSTSVVPSEQPPAAATFEPSGQTTSLDPLPRSFDSPLSPDQAATSSNQQPEGAESIAAAPQQLEDNWDTDYPTYTPQEQVLFQKPPPFLSRNQRKRWRFEQRQKY